MKIKNELIIALIKKGILETSTYNLEVNDAYKFIKFRKIIHNLFNTYLENEKEILSECNLTIDQEGKILGTIEDLDRFKTLRDKLYSEETEIDFETVSYKCFHNIQQNIESWRDPYLEDELEGIFWN